MCRISCRAVSLFLGQSVVPRIPALMGAVASTVEAGNKCEEGSSPTSCGAEAEECACGKGDEGVAVDASGGISGRPQDPKTRSAEGNGFV